MQYYCETLLLKLPVNYSIQKIIEKCTFVNIDNIIITTPDKKPLYRLVCMSHLKRLSIPPIKTFSRLGYKYIEIWECEYKPKCMN